MLLVLDNFEHLLAPASAPSAPGTTGGAHHQDRDLNLLTQLLQQAPGIKLLVTSRIRLNLKGEYIYPLSGIEYPAVETHTPATSTTSPQ